MSSNYTDLSGSAATPPEVELSLQPSDDETPFKELEIMLRKLQHQENERRYLEKTLLSLHPHQRNPGAMQDLVDVSGEALKCSLEVKTLSESALKFSMESRRMASLIQRYGSLPAAKVFDQLDRMEHRVAALAELVSKAYHLTAEVNQQKHCNPLLSQALAIGKKEIEWSLLDDHIRQLQKGCYRSAEAHLVN